jgi:tetratricopeptide (TPR) repeat protein
MIAWLVASSIGSATPMDRDFFTARLDPETERDLNLIDEAHTDRIWYWIRADRIQAAIADLNFVLDRFPNHPRALLLAEAVAGVTGVPTLPLPYYERALKIYPQYALTHSQYGKYLVEIGKIDTGIEELQQAIKISPNLATAHAWLAQAYKKAGKMDLAKKSAEQARKLGYNGDPFDASRKGQE